MERILFARKELFERDPGALSAVRAPLRAIQAPFHGSSALWRDKGSLVCESPSTKKVNTIYIILHQPTQIKETARQKKAIYESKPLIELRLPSLWSQIEYDRQHLLPPKRR